jgi:hypothetical protein
MPSRSLLAAEAELFHAGLGFTGMISAGDRQGVRWIRHFCSIAGGPTEILRLVMNYRTKTQWPRHLA